YQNFYFMGTQYPFKPQFLQWIPISFYGGVLIIAVISLVLGRLFCGWTCPHNTMTEWTRPIRALAGREPEPVWMKRLFQKKPQTKRILQIAAPILALVWTYGLTFLLSGFVVSPQWILDSYVQGSPHIALVFGQILFTLIGLFLLYSGHDFCRTCCPYGMGQSISAYQGGKWNPMEIQFTANVEKDCKSCTVCQQVCPVDIDPRDPVNLKVGLFDGCFNCGECIDACKFIHDFKNQPGFLSFQAPTWSASGTLKRSTEKAERGLHRTYQKELP
ncbi:MAG: 4Fe-4S binding protein, partial [Cyanobacteria bacterium]|nr:4Fe-4S binding protein [Cyanobacteriota bacterium]